MNKMTKTIASSVLGLAVLTSVLPATDVSFAAKNTQQVKNKETQYKFNKKIKKDQIVYNPFIYYKELKKVKSSLNNLGFTDPNGKELVINGYYDSNVDFALSEFLKSQGFEYFSKQSRAALFEQSENSLKEVIPEEIVTEEVTPEEVTPEEVTPEEIVPEEITPEEVTPEEVTPEEVVPEEVVPEEVTPEEVVPEEVVPEEVTPEEVVPEEIVPEEVVTEEIVYDASVYSEEVEYIKIALKRLNFTDHNGKELYINGYFDYSGQFALDSFLVSEGFEYFNEQAKKALFKKAEDSVIDNYDSSFTSGKNDLSSTAFLYSDLANVDNQWDPFYSMGIIKGFENIVVSRPDQMSYNAMKVADYVKSYTNVYGYVNLGPNNPESSKDSWDMANLDEVKSQIDTIADSGWSGIFIDQFGYDWGETRERQNIIIDHAHSRGLSVMANAWFPKDALGSEVDASGNPDGIASHLNSNDWSIVESFFTDGNSYTADSFYIDKYLQASEYSKETGVKISALSYKRNSSSWEDSQSDIETSYVLSHVLGFEGWWFAKYDNSNDFLYGRNPNIDLGSVIKPLALESNNKYVAETENYIVEYFGDETHKLNLIKK